jgi:hypothetical protein
MAWHLSKKTVTLLYSYAFRRRGRCQERVYLKPTFKENPVTLVGGHCRKQSMNYVADALAAVVGHSRNHRH